MSGRSAGSVPCPSATSFPPRPRRIVYHCYADGRDDAGGRPWLRREGSLNLAVAWIQHERELSALTDRLHPEPDEWPSGPRVRPGVTWFVKHRSKGDAVAVEVNAPRPAGAIDQMGATHLTIAA